MKKICMIVQDPMVKGGIASVVNGYRGSKLEKDYRIIYVESYKDGSKFEKLFKAIKGYFGFIKVLILDKPDIVHIHSSFGASFYRSVPFVYLASWAKKAIINHIHGSEFDKFYVNAGNKKKKLVKKIWSKCTKFIVLSEEWKKTFSVVIPKEKMEVIENYSKINSNVNRKENHNQVLFLGAINQMKGCYDIVDVIANVKKQIPNIKMIIAGDGEIEQVKQKSIKMGVENNIDFPGWVRADEKDMILRESDVFFLPSYSEGMPMSILDAMGYGLPIVSSNVGGISKLVHNGVNGYSFEPGNVEKFSESIIELLTNDEKRKDASKESLNIVINEYSFEKHLNLLETLYSNIV